MLFWNRRNFKLECFQNFATALSLGGDNIEFRPLRIGYSNKSDTRTQRKQEEVVKVVKESGTGSSYLDRLLQNVNSYMGLSKRSAREENDKLEEEVSLIGLLYIKLYEDHKDDLSPSEETLNQLNDLHASVKKLGSLPEKVSAVIRIKFLSILQ